MPKGFHFAGWMLMLVGGLSGVLASCSTTSPKDLELELARRELAEEINVGRGMAASILGRYPLVRDLPRWSDYVRAIGEAMHARIGRPELKPRFAIIESPLPNAFAAPGGFIFVTRGLIESLSSEDELVGVLAHEIAHVNERHVFQKVRSKKVSSTFILARLMSGGRGDMGQAVSKAVGAGLKMLLEEGLGPELEQAADAKGAEMAAVLAYEPRALHVYLQRTFGEQKVEAPGTHPPLAARLTALDETLKSGGIEALRDAVKLKSGVKSSRAARFKKMRESSGSTRPKEQQLKKGSNG